MYDEIGIGMDVYLRGAVITIFHGIAILSRRSEM